MGRTKNSTNLEHPKALIKLLGKIPDKILAGRFKLTPQCVCSLRRRKGIKVCKSLKVAWNKQYSWDEWFTREAFDLRKGIHFQVNPYVMFRQVYNAAYARGIKVSCRVNKNIVSVIVKRRKASA